MASRPLLLTVASAVIVLSLGAGSYLASRSNRMEAQRAATAAAQPAVQESAEAGRPASTQPAAPPIQPRRVAPPRESGARPVNVKADSRETRPAADAPARSQAADEPPVVPPPPAAAATAAPPTVTDPVPPPAAAPPVSAIEPPPVQESREPKYEEITIKEDSVIGIRLDQPVSTATAKVEDRVTARVTRDVTVDGRVAIPAGSRLEGAVTVIEPPGRFKTPARIGIRFTTLMLGDNVRVPIRTEAMYRNGESPAGPASAKIGAGAVGGAILGAVIGGRKGAIIGTTAGAAGGTAAVMASDREHAEFPGGALLTLRLSSDIRIQIERDPYDPGR